MSTLSSITLTIFALIVPLLVVHEHLEHQKIRNHGIELDGTIVGGYSKTKHGEISYTLRIEAVYEGDKYEDPVSVKKDVFDSHINGSWISKPKIKIKLNPSSPSEFLVASDTSQTPLWLWIIVISIGCFGLWNLVGLIRIPRISEKIK